MDNLGFYTSERWRSLRYAALRRYLGRCELCGRNKSHGIILHVDHIKPRSIRPDLEYDINNLQVLCEDCNLGKSNSDQIDWRTPSSIRKTRRPWRKNRKNKKKTKKERVLEKRQASFRSQERRGFTREYILKKKIEGAASAAHINL